MMKMRFKIMGSLIMTAMALCTSVAFAEDSPHEFSANVAISTDYRFRGITQTSHDPALSGGFDYAYTPFGFYAGVWASNLDFAEPTAGPGGFVTDTADLEVDFYGGFSGEFASFGTGWDIGGLYYYYPGSETFTYAATYDYLEVYGSLSHTFELSSGIPPIDVTGGLNYSPDYFAESGDATYLYGDVGIPLPAGLTLSGHVGHQWIDKNAVFGTPDYTDWSVGLSKDIGAFTFDVSYIDTDLDTSECFGGSDFCDATGVFTVSSSF